MRSIERPLPRIALGVFLATLTVSPQVPKPRPLTLPLECGQEDCLLLRGAPQTAGMRSGFVRLAPGATVGWHTTGANEEALVILRGHGEALIEGQANRALAASTLAYIPPATRHNVSNTGTDVLEYVYVVAAARQPLDAHPHRIAFQRQ